MLMCSYSVRYTTQYNFSIHTYLIGGGSNKNRRYGEAGNGVDGAKAQNAG